MAEENLPALPAGLFPPEWSHNASPHSAKAIRETLNNRRVRHGLLATVPMICRDDECPYKMHCVYQQRREVQRGERCVLEIGKLLEASERYYTEFGVDPADPGSRVDVVQISQLLYLEILIDRCQMLLGTQDMIEMVDVSVDPRSGTPISQPQLHKALDLLPKLQKQHGELLHDLHATRKDKINTATTMGVSIADYSKELIQASQIAAARLDLLRAGKLEQAELMGAQEMGEILESDLPQLKDES